MNDAYELGVQEGMKKVAFFGPSIHPFAGVGTPNIPGLLKRIRSGAKAKASSGVPSAMSAAKTGS